MKTCNWDVNGEPCGKPRMIGKKSGKMQPFCDEHQRAYWRAHNGYVSKMERVGLPEAAAGEKVCIQCQRPFTLSSENFPEDRRSRDGYAKLCRTCSESRPKRELHQRVFRPDHATLRLWSADGEKKCARCQRVFALNSDNFPHDGRSRDGFSKLCKSCYGSAPAPSRHQSDVPQVPRATRSSAPMVTPEALAEMRAPAPPVKPITDRVISEPLTVVLIDPDTNRAVLLDCVPRPLVFKVPEDAARFSHELTEAQRRGHIVAWRMSNTQKFEEADHVE